MPHSGMAKNAVDPFDDLGGGMLQLRRKWPLDPNMQRTAGFLPPGVAKGLRHGPAGILRADNITPPRDQLGLVEAESGKGHAPYFGQEHAYRSCGAATAGCGGFVLAGRPAAAGGGGLRHLRLMCQRQTMPVDRIPALLLAWYDIHARTLPWRIAPGTNVRPDPYRIWLSEIMLQQTNVTAVAPYFTRFTERWPTIAALAAAPDGDVMAAWAGLGYYSRARNLLAAARIMARDGFPTTEGEWRKLPGVGPYTAAAVAAIAFGERCVAVDANVERVGARLFAIDAPRPHVRAMVQQALTPIAPAARAGDFVQALMDLGSRICTPRRPDCMNCPLADTCKAYATHQPEAFPAKAPARVRPVRHGIVWWINRETDVALVRRPPSGLLGGMLGLPGSDWLLEEKAFCPPFPAQWQRVRGEVRHVFTHFELLLTTYMARIPPHDMWPRGVATPIWTPRTALATCGLPTLFRKVVDSVLAQEAEPCFESLC